MKRAKSLLRVGPRWLAVLLVGVATLSTPLAPAAAQEADAGVVDLVVELLNDSDREIRALALEQIRAEAPRIHCITNLAANVFTANVLLALGAVMVLRPDLLG